MNNSIPVIQFYTKDRLNSKHSVNNRHVVLNRAITLGDTCHNDILASLSVQDNVNIELVALFRSVDK